MKKITKIGLLCFMILATLGCEPQHNTTLNIVTTVYPITYLTEQIYEVGNITSIYPNGTDIKNYQLTEKQIKEYSKNDIFIYNGLSEEQETAKNLINQNNKLRIIDVAYGLKYENGLEELWLSPNYYLMLATTIKNNLQEQIDSKYTKDEIEKKYKNISETLSIMDAELRTIAQDAKSAGRSTIIASSNMFKYLNSYGFKVISLEENENTTAINLNNLKNNFKNSTYKTILMKDTDEKTEVIKTLEDAGAKLVTVNTMTTLTSEEKTNNETYLTIMKNYINDIKIATLGE